MGRATGKGEVSLGHLVLDTCPDGGGMPRLRVMKSCKFDEDMEQSTLDVMALNKVPYFCDGVVLGAQRRVALAQFSTHQHTL